MTLNSKEHHELMIEFEKSYKNERLDRESKDLWNRGIIYQNGEVNSLFLAYRLGYMLGRLNYMH